MTYLLVAVVAALPFMDLEVLRVGEKSIVLPYAVTLLLVFPLSRRLREALSVVRRDRALPWLIGWALIACLSGAWSYVEYQSSTMLAKNVTQLANVGLMVVQYVLLVAAIGMVPAAGIPCFVRTIVVTSVAAAVVSIAQVVMVFAGFPPPDLFRTSNLYFKLNTLVPGGGGSWAGVPRTLGFAPEPSFWGAYLAAGCAIMIGRFDLHRRVADLAGLVLMVLAILLTFARGAWFSLALLAPVWLSLRHRRALTATPVLIVLLVAVLMVPWPTFVGQDSVLARADDSAAERLSTQKTGLVMFADHPILGVGLGSIEFLIEDYAFFFPGYGSSSFTVLHNWYLTVLAATGIIGGVCFMGFLVALVRSLGRACASIENGDRRSDGLGALLALVTVFGFWVNTPAYNMTFIWFVFAFSTAVAIRDPRSVEPSAV